MAENICKSYILVHSGCYKKNTDCMAYKKLKFIAHNLGGWKSQIRGPVEYSQVTYLDYIKTTKNSKIKDQAIQLEYSLKIWRNIGALQPWGFTQWNFKLAPVLGDQREETDYSRSVGVRVCGFFKNIFLVEA